MGTSKQQGGERGTSTGADHAAVAGVADATVQEKTGRDWAAWTRTLDELGAAALGHGEIARIVEERFEVSGWWAQTVTVGYERIRGLRAHGQRRDGGWEISRSRTFDAPVDRLFDAWADEHERGGWLTDAQPTVTTATKPRSMRMRWPDGTRVAVHFTAKGDARSAVTVQHAKLPDRESGDVLKVYWSEQLDALGAWLTARRRPD